MSLIRRALMALAAVITLVCAQPALAAYTFTDLADRTVRIDKQPERFIVANYIANFLMVGGADSLNKVVAMTQDGWEKIRFGEYTVFTEAFPQLKTLPSIGGYHDNILNSERILALKPDVLLINNSQYADNSQRVEVFEKAGIRVVVLDYHSMKPERHAKSTDILGQLLDRRDVAQRQCERYQSVLADIQDRIAKLPESLKHRRVYLETGSQGVMTYGNTYNKTVLWGAILHNLQADNLAENMRQPYGSVDREFVIAGNPQTIVITGSLWQNSHLADSMRMGLTVAEADAQQRLAGFANRPQWSRLDAVKTGEIYSVDHGSLRCMLDYTFSMYLAKVLYPETFADYDPQAELEGFYKSYLPEVSPRGTFFLKYTPAK